MLPDPAMSLAELFHASGVSFTIGRPSVSFLLSNGGWDKFETSNLPHDVTEIRWRWREFVDALVYLCYRYFGPCATPQKGVRPGVEVMFLAARL